MQSIIINLIVLVLGASSALADVVTKCNSPQGYSYFIAGTAVPKKEAGWVQDSISKGSYLLTHDADGKYDIIFSDALNRTISSREDGGDVIVVSKSDNHLVLVVAYPEMNVETWYFRIDRSGATRGLHPRDIAHKPAERINPH
jgi:hypothetical protein